MNKLDPWRIGFAAALTAAAINVICAVAFYVYPDGMIDFVGSWMHGLDLTVLRGETKWSLGAVAYGLLSVSLTGFLAGALFAFFCNLTGRSRSA